MKAISINATSVLGIVGFVAAIGVVAYELYKENKTEKVVKDKIEEKIGTDEDINDEIEQATLKNTNLEPEQRAACYKQLHALKKSMKESSSEEELALNITAYETMLETVAKGDPAEIKALQIVWLEKAKDEVYQRKYEANKSIEQLKYKMIENVVSNIGYTIRSLGYTVRSFR